MAQKFTVPITVKQLASAGSDAVTVYVDQDTFSRLKVEAGGRLTWGSGASAGDVNLYRASADVLQTDDTFKTPTLFVDNIEIDTTGATTTQALVFNGVKFVPGDVAASGGASLTVSDTAPASPEVGDLWFNSSNARTYVYYDSSWVEVGASGGVATLDDIGNVTAPSPSNGDLIQWNGTAWVNVASSTVGATNLDGLTDVTITSATNGQILVYNGTNWVNTVRPSNEPMGHENKDDSVISFNEGTRTFSIAPASTSYTVWCAGKRFVKTGTETVEIPDTSGLYYIYFSSSGVLSYRTSYFVWDTDAPTAYIYWNEVDNKAYFFADERHGITLDWATHEYLHRTRGAAIANGFGVSNYSIDGNGSSDTHAKFDLAGGTFFDEDLQVDIVHSNTPTANTWEQVLEGNAEIPVFYRTNNHWKKDTATEFAFKQGTSRPQYNLFSSPNWSTVDIANNKFAISWIIATNNLNEPVIAIMGQDEYLTIGEAEAAAWEDLNLDGFPIVEFRPLHKVVFQGTDSFTNSVNAAIRGIYDLRRVSSNGSAIPSTPVSDHGSMTGLADDDHTQYLTDARHNALDHSTAMASVVLDDIYDVNTSGASAGDVLTYNGSIWTAASAASGGSTVTASTTPPSSPESGSIWFDSSTAKTYVYYDSFWVEIGGTSGGAKMYVSETAPSTPLEGQLWFKSDTAQTFAYYDSFWVEVGAAGMAAIAADAAPASPVTGQLWFNSSTGGTYVYYDSAWIEVGAVAANTVFNLVDAKGDLLLGTADNTLARQAVGTNGQLLQANSSATNGVEWITPTYAPAAGPTFTGTVVLPSTTSIGTVTSTEIGYVDGVTSAIQTQLDSKAPLAGPTFTGTVVLPSTTSIGTITSTELGYVDGVTSAIQTQLNAKAPTASPTFTGDVAGPGRITATNASGNVWLGDWTGGSAYRGVGTNNTFLLLGHATDTNSYLINNTGGISLRTAGLDRINASSTGWVTTPYNPSFSSYNVNAASAGQDLVFATTTVNAGSCYNTSNGRFTAPIAGSYWFAYNCLQQNGNTGEYRHALYKNGGGVGGLRFIFFKDAAGWQSTYAYGVIYLAANDYVTLRYESGAGVMYTDGNYSNFSGYLIG